MYDPLGRHKAQSKEMRSFLIFLTCLAIFLGGFSLYYKDDFVLNDKECAVLNHLWQTKYHKDFRFAGSWESGIFACKSQDARMAQAIYFLDTTKFVLPDGTTGIDFYAWLKKIDPQFGKKWMSNYAGMSVFEDNQLNISIDMLAQENPVIIAGIIVHEARHLEEGYNTHVACTNDTELTCDSRLEKNLNIGGAYSYNMYYYDHLRKYSNAGRAAKRIAKERMQYIFDHKFNSVDPKDRQKYDLD